MANKEFADEMAKKIMVALAEKMAVHIVSENKRDHAYFEGYQDGANDVMQVIMEFADEIKDEETAAIAQTLGELRA